jgi:predicted glutamine amidotransferase
MCRLILATGEFSSAQVLDAAIAMSCGRTANHDGPTQRHLDGWGAVWRHGDRLAIHRDARSIEDSADASPVRALTTRFLAVHVRYATQGSGIGAAYTHPLPHVQPGRSWYLLHNGTLPTLYQRLGKSCSEFDSAEYLEYLMRDAAAPLDLEAARAKLHAIPPGGTSANAFLITDDCAYVIHWTPEDSRHPRYFTMYRLDTDRCTIIASEIVESLAPSERWRPLPARTIQPIQLAS